MAIPPQLTAEQRRAALEKAAHARQIRAEIKNQLKMGTLSLEQLLARADEEPMVAKIKALAALESLPGIGKVTARRTMERIGIAESRRLSGLGPQQRKALLEELS
jgi:nucleotidyltransferase/DNA polymerase involved in DNA repair